MEDETVILGWGERSDFNRQSCGTLSWIVMTAAQSKGTATGPFRYGRRADNGSGTQCPFDRTSRTFAQRIRQLCPCLGLQATVQESKNMACLSAPLQGLEHHEKETQWDTSVSRMGIL